MGLQIALVGMTSIDLIVNSDQTLVTLGNLGTYKIWLSLAGLVLIGTLLYHNIKGGILIGIFAVSLLSWYIENSFPKKITQFPYLTKGFSDYINFVEFNMDKCLSAIVAFVFIGIIDVSGVIFGMAKLANLIRIDDSIPGSRACFLGVSVSTIVGACMGSTPVIVYVESAAGIKVCNCYVHLYYRIIIKIIILIIPALCALSLTYRICVYLMQ